MMKALQFQGIGRLGLIEADVPRPGPGELLISTGAAIICTSDVNELRTGVFGAQLPIIFGHEGAGTVAAIGDDVREFAVGDRVAAHPVHSCGSCTNCLAGMAHLCANMRHFGLNMAGTFAEYFVVAAARARKVTREVPFTAAALAEPVSVCLQALAQARIDRNSQLLILGDGPFGILMSMLARSKEIGRIVMTGEQNFRLVFSQAHETINIHSPAAEQLRFDPGSPFAGGPFDAAILAVASPAALQQAIAQLRPKGRLVIFSALNDPTPVDLLAVHLRELEIIGACNDEDRLSEAVARITATPQLFDRIVTHRFVLGEYEQAFALAASGHDRALKVAFTFGQP
jgi:threonine dehydrogenase-like Zn-dependent dehydrogenase